MTNYCFLSFIGMQPSTTAVKIQTLWEQAQKTGSNIVFPRHFIFWNTSHTQPFCEHLESWLKDKERPWNSEDSVFVESSDQKMKMTDDLGKNLYYDADSGAAFFVASTLLDLPEEAVILHSDHHHMLLGTPGSNEICLAPLANIGWNELLKLYQLESKIQTKQRTDVNPPNWVLDGLKSLGINYICGVKTHKNSYTIDLAFESHGRLFLLFILTDKFLNTKNRSKNDFLRALLANYQIESLRPQIGIIDIGNGAQQDYIEAVAAQVETVKVIRKQVDLGSLIEPTSKDHPLEESGALPQQIEGKTLICGLGNDISATLASILTHQPQQILLLQDQTTPVIVELLSNLQSEFKILPIKTNFWCQGVLSQLADCSFRNEVILDITPGSKIQTDVLTHFYRNQKYFDLQLWSMNYTSGKASMIKGLQKRPPTLELTDINQPSLEQLARLNQPKIQIENKIDFTSWITPKNGAVLDALMKLYQERLTEKNYDLNEGHTLSKEKNKFSYPDHSGNQYCLTYPKEVDGTKKGTAFEFVVAHQLYHYALNKKLENFELILGLKFHNRGGGTVDIDLDIVARMGKFIWCIECKSINYNSYSGLTPIQLTSLMGKIRNDSYRHLGRKAVPILVFPKLTNIRKLEIDALRKDLQNYALLLDLEDFKDDNAIDEIQKLINQNYNEM